jgi:hypothetical protein
VLGSPAGSASPRGRGRTRRIGNAVVAIASFLIIAVVVVTALALRSASSNAGAAQTTKHFARAGISLDYPASWTVTTEDHPAHYDSVLAFIGSGTASQSCGSDYIPGLGACDDVYEVGPDQVVLRVALINGPPPVVDFVTDALNNDPSATAATVAGQKAAVQDTTVNGQTAVVWTLPNVAGSYGAFQITAIIAGPDVTQGRAAANAVVQTVSYDKATAP